MPAVEIVTAVPLALRPPARDALEPTVTVPKLSPVGETVSTPGLAPVPESAMFRVEFEPSEMIVNVPLALPAVAGVKLDVKVTLWAGFNVNGKDSPETENPVPETFACEIVTGDPPEFVNVSYRLAVFPTCTLPKARLDGFALSVPVGAPATVTAYCFVER